mmetsp:Transcript_16108/g.18244  ORF Transcript_16108/g.18244 Transcript_16108/m.18244 type:complete len:189 (-) Transcript_16108:1952-2518(-)
MASASSLLYFGASAAALLFSAYRRGEVKKTKCKKVEVVIRLAQTQDLPQLLKLWRQYISFIGQSQSEQIETTTWERLLSDKEPSMFSIVAATEDGSVAGFANSVLTYNTSNIEKGLYLEDLFVDSRYRGQGIGKALIMDLKSKAEKRSLSRLFWVTEDDNYNAQKLYDKVACKSNYIQYNLKLEAGDK